MFCSLFLVAINSAISCLQTVVSEMTCYVWSATLNSEHSLTHVHHQRCPRSSAPLLLISWQKCSSKCYWEEFWKTSPSTVQCMMHNVGTTVKLQFIPCIYCRLSALNVVRRLCLFEKCCFVTPLADPEGRQTGIHDQLRKPTFDKIPHLWCSAMVNLANVDISLDD